MNNCHLLDVVPIIADFNSPQIDNPGYCLLLAVEKNPTIPIEASEQIQNQLPAKVGNKQKKKSKL